MDLNSSHPRGRRPESPWSYGAPFNTYNFLVKWDVALANMTMEHEGWGSRPERHPCGRLMTWTRGAVLAAFDEQVRRNPVPEHLGGRVEHADGVIRVIGGGAWNGVVWADLDADDADAAIAAQLECFADAGESGHRVRQPVGRQHAPVLARARRVPLADRAPRRGRDGGRLSLPIRGRRRAEPPDPPAPRVRGARDDDAVPPRLSSELGRRDAGRGALHPAPPRRVKPNPPTSRMMRSTMRRMVSTVGLSMGWPALPRPAVQ